MSVLLLAEINNGEISLDATAKSLTAAKLLGDVTILCASNNCKVAAETAAKLEGIVEVLIAEDEAYSHGLAEPLADLLVKLAPDYSHIVAPATSNAKNVLPRLAALLDVMIISDVIDVIDTTTFERPTYAGNAIETVKSEDSKHVLSIRTTAFEATPATGKADIRAIESAANPGLSEWVEDKISVSERPELTSSKIVISGGRGVGSKENFAIIESLADKLGAAIGASRAAVDAGFAPNDWQVGQTGKVVAPDLYIAIGISGAIQHLAGMKDSKIIVAINKDEEAPIFQVADFGLVADLFTAVPELEKALDS